MNTPATLAERIAAHPFMRDVPRKFIPILAENALDTCFEPNEVIFRAGDLANRFYLIEDGEIQIEASQLNRVVPIQLLGPGEVLGWSWIFPPYQWQFDARALLPTIAIFLYGTRLRDACEEQPELGYALMKATAQVLVRRLQATRREVFFRADQGCLTEKTTA